MLDRILEWILFGLLGITLFALAVLIAIVVYGFTHDQFIYQPATLEDESRIIILK